MLENPSVEQDRDLIRRMASKDVTALDAFYERHNRVAFSLVLRIVGHRSDSEDVLVDVFSHVWHESSRYDTSHGNPVPWLLTIARTRAVDALRSSKLQQKNKTFENERPKPVTEPDRFVRSDIRWAVVEAVQELSEQQRVPLEMAYFQGMNPTQIASTLKRPPETVKDGIRAGMTHLRERLKAFL